MKEKELAALASAARALGERGVVWGVGASLLLWRRGIAADFHDIDLLVAERDALAAADALEALGTMTNCKRSAPYTTAYFYEFTLGGVELDLMGSFGVALEGARYDFDFGADDIADFEQIGGALVPFCRVEDWYVLYQLIPGREEKVRMIESCLLRFGGADRAALGRWLDRALPDNIRERTRHFLKLLG